MATSLTKIDASSLRRMFWWTARAPPVLVTLPLKQVHLLRE